MLLLVQGYFLWCPIFLVEFLGNFLKSVALVIKFSMLRYTILIFSKTFLEVLQVLFGNFEAKKGRTAYNIEIYFINVK